MIYFKCEGVGYLHDIHYYFQIIICIIHWCTWWKIPNLMTTRSHLASLTMLLLNFSKNRHHILYIFSCFAYLLGLRYSLLYAYGVKSANVPECMEKKACGLNFLSSSRTVWVSASENANGPGAVRTISGSCSLGKQHAYWGPMRFVVSIEIDAVFVFSLAEIALLDLLPGERIEVYDHSELVVFANLLQVFGALAKLLDEVQSRFWGDELPGVLTKNDEGLIGLFLILVQWDHGEAWEVTNGLYVNIIAFLDGFWQLDVDVLLEWYDVLLSDGRSSGRRALHKSQRGELKTFNNVIFEF